MFLYSNQIFRNIYKTSFLLISLYIPILSVLTLALDIVVLYENFAFFVAVLSTKKRYSSFPQKVFIFQKTCFKVKVMKTFKISKKKMPIFEMESYFRNHLVLLFSGTYIPSAEFKMKPLRVSVFLC